nr:HNH endonuclease domain-containing protein [Paenisporosarcina sp. OV554]
MSIQYDSSVDLDLNGVWNLVLACQDCNRGEKNGKYARLSQIHFLDRLIKRETSILSKVTTH